VWERLWWSRPPCLLRQVIVNLADDAAIRGVLWRTQGPWLVLRDAALLKAHGDPIAMDGEIVVHRGTVRFVQVLP
jgi:hypothetical protein